MALTKHRTYFEIQDALGTNGTGDICDIWKQTRNVVARQIGAVIVQKLLATERLEALQDPIPDPTYPNGTDNFTFEPETFLDMSATFQSPCSIIS